MNIDLGIVFCLLFSSILFISSVLLLRSWMIFVDNQLDRKLEKEKITNEKIENVKKDNKSLKTLNMLRELIQKKQSVDSTEISKKNIVIDVECEIINEKNDIIRYL